MGEPVRYQVRTGREDRPVAGEDTSVITIPDGVYLDAGGERVLVLRRLGRLLRQVSEMHARDVGMRLHHAEWVITGDPGVVEATVVHDCARCRAGADQALAWLREHPGGELLVGTLYWAAP